MRLRKIWCEGNFSHQKANHNLRKTFKRGNEKVTEHCLLSACALNLKRLVKYLKGRCNTPKLLIYIQIYLIKTKIKQAKNLNSLSDYFFTYLSTAPFGYTIFYFLFFNPLEFFQYLCCGIILYSFFKIAHRGK